MPFLKEERQKGCHARCGNVHQDLELRLAEAAVVPGTPVPVKEMKPALVAEIAAAVVPAKFCCAMERDTRSSRDVLVTAPQAEVREVVVDSGCVDHHRRISQVAKNNLINIKQKNKSTRTHV